MSKFIFKPEYVDFGFEPCVQTIGFIHEGTSITIVSKPNWIESVTSTYTPYSSGSPLQGYLTATISYDVGQRKSSGYIEVLCDSDTYYIPTIYSYDSEHIPIGNVVDTTILGLGEYSYVGEKDRMRCMLAAKRWVQDHPRTSSTHIRFAELNIEDDGSVYIPSDFVDYIALHTYSTDGFLLPLYVNNDMNRSSGHLLDNNSMYILDSNGYAISVHGLIDSPDPNLQILEPNSIWPYEQNVLQTTYNIRFGKLSFNGMYKYIPDERKFIISAVPTDKIVLQYISDPILADKMKLDIGDVRIHKFYQEALEYYIYQKLIENDMSVPQNEKFRALRAYKLALKRSERRKLKVQELIQLIRGYN